MSVNSNVEGVKMCNHEFKKMNDNVSVCVRCGLTNCNGRILFDKKIVNYKPKRGAKNGKKRK